MDNFNMSKDEANWVEFGQSLQQVTDKKYKLEYKHKYQ